MNEIDLMDAPPVIVQDGQVRCTCPFCAGEAIDNHFDPDEGLHLRCTDCGRQWLVGTEHELVIEPAAAIAQGGEAAGSVEQVERDLLGMVADLLGVVQSQRRQLAILDVRMSRAELQIARRR